MPATRVTVASNAKQSQKSPLLIPVSAPLHPSSPGSCQSLVFKTAQSKLRLKKPSRIFVAGTGQELSTSDDWKCVLKDDITLLVSTGEAYIGAAKELSKAETALAKLGLTKPKPTLSILSHAALVDPISIQQLETTASTLPGILHGVAQPDLHPGNKFPIGAVFVSEGWIHPPLIGGDIGCGMAWYKTHLRPGQVAGDKAQRIANSLRGVEGPWRDRSSRLAWLSAASIASGKQEIPTAGEDFDASLGTIGAGNHFAELQLVESILSLPAPIAAHAHALAPGDVVLLVHSGSRGYGGDILKRYTADGAATSIQIDDPKAREYLNEHDRACAWAERSRDLIALRFFHCLEPGDPAWDLGSDRSKDTPGDIEEAYQRVQQRKVVGICHNNMSLTLWPPTDPSFSPPPEQSEVYIHRKGAAPIHPLTNSQTRPSPNPENLLPILPLPGSRGTPTLILQPNLSTANGYGFTNGLSLAHGAGRALSRAKAFSSLSNKYKGNTGAMLGGNTLSKNNSQSRPSYEPESEQSSAGEGPENRDTGTSDEEKERLAEEREMEGQEKEGRKVHGGSWVVCEDKQLVWEEAPEAYKDVWDVGRDLVDAGAARRVGWCRGLVSYKVRRE